MMEAASVDIKASVDADSASDDLCHQRRQSRALSVSSRRCWAMPRSTSRTFHLGRNKPGGDAIALVEVDGEVPADALPRRWRCRM